MNILLYFLIFAYCVATLFAGFYSYMELRSGNKWKDIFITLLVMIFWTIAAIVFMLGGIAGMIQLRRELKKYKE